MDYTLFTTHDKYKNPTLAVIVTDLSQITAMLYPYANLEPEFQFHECTTV